MNYASKMVCCSSGGDSMPHTLVYAAYEQNAFGCIGGVRVCAELNAKKSMNYVNELHF